MCVCSQTDKFRCPPGVLPQKPWRIRTEYFDSRKQVVQCLKSLPADYFEAYSGGTLSWSDLTGLVGKRGQQATQQQLAAVRPELGPAAQQAAVRKAVFGDERPASAPKKIKVELLPPPAGPLSTVTGRIVYRRVNPNGNLTFATIQPDVGSTASSSAAASASEGAINVCWRRNGVAPSGMAASPRGLG